jgi:GTPase SAR1 family protein
LIHPGRVIRLEREVTPEGAQIAVNLVSLIAKEVALRRKLNYGPTAEQILAKIETDEHSLAVLPELLSEAKEHELARLVATLIPDAYRSEEAGFTDQALLSRFRDLYRRALVLLPEAEQVRVAEKFALAVRQESAERIRAYSDAFFSAEDIKHLQAKDSAIVVKYLLNQLDQPTTSVTPELLKSMEGIGKYIESKSAQRFADTLIRLVLRPNKEKLQPIQKFVHAEYDNIADEASKKVMEERLAVWIKYQEGKPAAEAVSRLQRVADFWVDIPF